MNINLESIEAAEWLILGLLLYYGVAILFWFVGKWLNEAVIRANDGVMPVVENRKGDKERFGEAIKISSRHEWANENTKLLLLSDWINPPPWRNCPYVLALFISRCTNYNILEHQKISIGDIFIWTSMGMGSLAIIGLSALMIFLLIYLLLFLL